jgi:hypothetical protein
VVQCGSTSEKYFSHAHEQQVRAAQFMKVQVDSMPTTCQFNLPEAWHASHYQPQRHCHATSICWLCLGILLGTCDMCCIAPYVTMFPVHAGSAGPRLQHLARVQTTFECFATHPAAARRATTRTTASATIGGSPAAASAAATSSCKKPQPDYAVTPFAAARPLA